MIEIKRTFDKQFVEDVIVTALEGGSNYWYYLTDATVKAIKTATPEMNGEPLSIRFTAALDNGLEIDIHDYEDPREKLGTISKATMGDRTQKLIDDGYGDRLGHDEEFEGDGDDADIIFQYWVLNDIVYG